MKTLRISLAQINSVVGDIAGNSRKIIRYIKGAKILHTDVIVFPELALSGYPPEDLLLKPHFIKENSIYLKKIVKATDKIVAIVGIPSVFKGKLFNTAAIIYNKKLLGFCRKVELPNYGVFDELRYFHPGEAACILTFKTGLKIGVNICEDIWQIKGPFKMQSLKAGSNIIINISSSPYDANKMHLRQKLLTQRAKETKNFIVYSNLVGAQDELVFDGASMVIDPKGKLVARAKQFCEDLLTVDIDLALLIKRQAKKASSRGLARLKLSKIQIRHKIIDKKIDVLNRIEKKLKPLAEIYAALTLGLKDYVTKNGFKRVILGLSGGIDSALVAAISVDALGKNNVVALSMPSMFSSKETKDDAKRLAANLGIKFLLIPINSIYNQYLSVLHNSFKRRSIDITEENLQARIRANLLMAFSNKFGHLVVTTGNKSELSVGYCTLYGDTAGGFALIKDVPKTLVYKLARFKNEKDAQGIIPKSFFKRAPSAELKKDQKDQDTLPRYSTLDAIIDAYVEGDKSLSEIKAKGFSPRLLRRIISLIDKNEYKRRQYALGVKITPKAFGRDRRMPITNRFTQKYH